ncbi:MAG: DUF192 domain-containing protein [Oligoflexia bacterium]|nr:DUF192 domain-containing protein [Oligoflexia bacterium]
MKKFLFLILFLSFTVSQAKPLERKTIKVGASHVKVEIADRPESRAQGLMFRKHLPSGEGMLFVFEKPEIQAFWMKNTLIPLSIGYFDSRGSLFQILDMEPASPMELNPKTYPSRQPALYALEVPRGWFQKAGIKTGDKLQLNQASSK